MAVKDNFTPNAYIPRDDGTALLVLQIDGDRAMPSSTQRWQTIKSDKGGRFVKMDDWKVYIDNNLPLIKQDPTTKAEAAAIRLMSVVGQSAEEEDSTDRLLSVVGLTAAEEDAAIADFSGSGRTSGISAAPSSSKKVEAPRPMTKEATKPEVKDKSKSVKQNAAPEATPKPAVKPTEKASAENTQKVTAPSSSSSSSFTIDSNSTCKQLKDKFKTEFGGVLRVKNGNRRVPDDETLSKLGVENESIECGDTFTVGEFQIAFKEKTGLSAVVATVDDWVAVIPEMPMRLVGKVPKNTTVEKMKAFLDENR